MPAAVVVVVSAPPPDVHRVVVMVGAHLEKQQPQEQQQQQRPQEQQQQQQQLVLAAPYNSMRAIARYVAGTTGDVCVDVTAVPAGLVAPLMHILAKHCYTFLKYRTGADQRPAPSEHAHRTGARRSNAQRRSVLIFDGRRGNLRRNTEMANAITSADIARDLENEPANHMTPDMFCKSATKILRALRDPAIKIRVMDEHAIRREGLGLVTAVGQSSAFPPRFMVVERLLDAGLPTVCLVGKGVTFDAGGLRLKTAPAMIDMKQDKSGAAIVVAIIHYVAAHHRDLPVNLVGIMPMVENVINGRAMKPGDIVTAHNGSNVEIMDPDAEGRLILADAISYSSRYKPDYVLDFATLTAFASTICCDLSACYYTRSDDMSRLIYALGEATGERCWRHPPWDEYRINTLSQVADTRNAIFDCTRSGSFMAAMFISNFVQRDVAKRWVHFDIANNDVRGIHSANSAVLGMQLVIALASVGTKRSGTETSALRMAA